MVEEVTYFLQLNYLQNAMIFREMRIVVKEKANPIGMTQASYRNRRTNGHLREGMELFFVNRRFRGGGEDISLRGFYFVPSTQLLGNFQINLQVVE